MVIPAKGKILALSVGVILTYFKYLYTKIQKYKSERDMLCKKYPPSSSMSTPTPKSQVAIIDDNISIRLPILPALVAFLLPLFIGLMCVKTFSHVQISHVINIFRNVQHPTTFQGAGEITTHLRALSAAYPTSVLSVLVLIYAFLQTLCIPGTLVINVVCGALYGPWIAFPICVLAGTLGACSGYGLSRIVGYPLIHSLDQFFTNGSYLPLFRQKLNEHRRHQFIYLMFLRISPLLPNWFINLASPIVGVPLRPYILSTFLGIIPQSLLVVRVGSLLADFAIGQAENGVYGTKPLVGLHEWVTLVVLGIFILAFIILRRNAERRA